MAIYLGDSGFIELKRRSVNETLVFVLHASDVDTRLHRFSFDGINDEGVFMNGDRVEFLRTDGTANLQLVEGVDERGATYYVHVDSVGGIRLYDNFGDAVNGGEASSLDLVIPTEDQEVQVSLQDVRYRCLAEVGSYEITTQRETVDLTVLGDEFRRSYGSGLISGQGQCRAFWNTSATESTESVHYLIQLVQRLEMGALFDAHFYIRRQDTSSLSTEYCDDSRDIGLAVWWDVSCIVTNASVTFEPTQLLQASIQFVTSGPFSLKTGTPPGLLLQEDYGTILEEQLNTPIALDTDT